MTPQRKALLVATYGYQDDGLRGLAAPAHDAEELAEVLRDPAVAGFDVTMLLNEPTHVVGEAIGRFYAGCRRDDLALLYFSGHGLKDDDGRLYLAMTNTRRDSLLFTGLPAAAISDAMDGCPSRRKVLVLDCCYSGAFPAGRTAKADPDVHTLERFQGKGRAVLTASDATSYSFEGDEVSGSGAASVFTRYLVDAIRSGAADLDSDGDITLDELYSYVHDRVVAELPHQRPKKQEDVDGRIVVARNVHWQLPAHLRYALDSPIAAQRLSALDGLADLHRRGNEVVRAAVEGELGRLADDDSRSVATAAGALLERVTAGAEAPRLPAPRPPVPEPVPVAAHERPAAPPPRPPQPLSPPADTARPRPPAETEPPAGTEPPAAPSAAPGWSAPNAVVVLAVLGLVPLTLVQVLHLESSYPFSAHAFGLPLPAWVLAVLLPLAAGALLLLLRDRWPRGEAVAHGLVLGAGLVLVEATVFWTSFFADPNVSYQPGPALWAVYAGAAIVVVDCVVVLTRSPLAGRPAPRRDWRLACALVVLVSAAVSVGSVSATNGWDWLQGAVGPVVLGLAALAVTVLRVRRDQAVAGLVAVVVLGFWLAYLLVAERAQQPAGIAPGDRPTQLVGVVLAVGACAVASAGVIRGPARRP